MYVISQFIMFCLSSVVFLSTHLWIESPLIYIYVQLKVHIDVLFYVHMCYQDVRSREHQI
jgi:hypothetical protein